MPNQDLVDAVAKLIEPELFALPASLQSVASHRFVENTWARAREIITLVRAENAPLVRSQVTGT
jgi:hypothetical protein